MDPIDLTNYAPECSNVEGEEIVVPILDHIINQALEKEKFAESQKNRVHCNTCKYLHSGTYDYVCKFETEYETPVGFKTKYNRPYDKNKNYDCKDFVKSTSFVGKLFRLGLCGLYDIK